MKRFEFDSVGNLYPYEIIECELEDINRELVGNFVNSATRKLIFQKYQAYNFDFKSFLKQPFTQWIGGSFATKKVKPNDIDVVNLLIFEEKNNAKMNGILSFLQVGGSLEKYLVDAHLIVIYEPDDERFLFTKQSIDYWKSWLGFDRNSNPKGILELKNDEQL